MNLDNNRLFLFLGFTLITIIFQYLLTTVVIKDSVKKQILFSSIITSVWYIVVIYSTYKKYYDLFFYAWMWIVLVFIINSILSNKENSYDSRKIKSKYKSAVIIIGFISIGLLWLEIINIYVFLTLAAIVLLLINFIDYKNYITYH